MPNLEATPRTSTRRAQAQAHGSANLFLLAYLVPLGATIAFLLVGLSGLQAIATGATLTFILVAGRVYRQVYTQSHHLIDVAWLQSLDRNTPTSAGRLHEMRWRTRRGHSSIDLRDMPAPTLYGVHSGPVLVGNAEDSATLDRDLTNPPALLRNHLFQYWWLRTPATTADTPLDLAETPRPISVLRVNSEAERVRAQSLVNSIRPIGIDVRVVIDPPRDDIPS